MAATRGPHQPAVREPFRQAEAHAGNGQHPVGPGHADPVADRDPGVVRDPSVVVDEQHRTAHPAQDVLHRGTQPLEPFLVVAPQEALREPDRRLDEGGDRRVEAEGRTADVDDAEQLAGARVVDRCGRAVPGVLLLLEVLRREELDRRLLGQRGPDRVGADRRLGPHRALAEPEPVGVEPHGGRPLAPEDHAVGVGDDHQEP
jgi:hypothetical protein